MKLVQLHRIPFLILIVLFMSGNAVKCINNNDFVRLETKISPPWEYIVAFKDGILVDANLDEWEDWPSLSITINNLSDATKAFNITIFLAHNTSHLFSAFTIPNTLGIVKGLELWFFGKERVYDVVYINAETNESFDKAYIHNKNPTLDLENGGKENIIASSSISRTGTIFEFSKDLLTIDENGWDLHLVEGDSIALVINTWISISPEELARPNFSTINSRNFNYVRLSVGYDTYQELSISYPVGFTEISNPFIVQETYVTDFSADGVKLESFWSKASTYSITLYNIKSSENLLINSDGVNTTDQIKGKISFIHDNDKLYTFLTLEYNKEDNSYNAILLFYSKDEAFIIKQDKKILVTIINETSTNNYIENSSNNPFCSDYYGSLGPRAKYVPYYDANDRIDFNDTSSSDIDYSDDECDVEFSQPIINKLKSEDFSLSTNDPLYLSILVVCGSRNDYRMYTSIILEDYYEKYLINPIYLEKSEKSTNKNSASQFTSPISFLVVCNSFLVLLISTKKKKKDRIKKNTYNCKQNS